MLISYRKGLCALAAALTFSGVAAQAEVHEVIIVDGSYFPRVIFASEDDQILFLNESDATHTINGEEDSWTSGPIAPNASFELTLSSETPSTFSGTVSADELADGEIVFVGD